MQRTAYVTNAVRQAARSPPPCSKLSALLRTASDLPRGLRRLRALCGGPLSWIASREPRAALCGANEVCCQTIVHSELSRGAESSGLFGWRTIMLNKTWGYGLSALIAFGSLACGNAPPTEEVSQETGAVNGGPDFLWWN